MAILMLTLVLRGASPTMTANLEGLFILEEAISSITHLPEYRPEYRVVEDALMNTRARRTSLCLVALPLF